MKEKPFRLFSRVALVLLMMMLTATSAWATITGSGTEADPYVINTEDDWNTAATTMQYYYNSSSYVYIKLGADLNFSGKTFNMYGNYDNKIHFDGQGYTISGITIDKPSDYPAAPFYWLNSGGSISRLTIANSTIYAHDHVAGIVAYNAGTISDCHVASSVTLKVGDTYCGGIVAHNYMPLSPSTAGTVTGCTVAARLQLPYRQYNSVSLGGIVGAQNSAGTISNCLFYGSMEVDKGGTTTLFGCITEYNHGTITGNCYCPIGTYHAFKSESDTDGAAAVSKVSGIPDGVTVSSAATYTYGGNTYCAQNAVTTITPPANTAFRTFTATGATYSLSADKRSASLTLGTSDATVTATLQTIGGSCGTSASWTLTQDGDGNYTRLTISGTGEMNDYTHITNGKDSYWRTSATWGYDLTSVTIPDGITSIGDFAFCGCQQLTSITIGSSVQNIGYASINHCDGLTTVDLPASVNSIEYAAFENCVNLARVNIGKSDGVITGENPFNGCHANLIIAVPTPALVLQYKAASILSGYASKLRAAFGSQVFNAIGTVSDAAYEIANADDLRHLATAVNQDHQGGNGLTFRQTDDITLTGAFTPIGYYNESSDKQFFYGTYDGGEHTITGLSVSGDYYYAGLFGSVNAGGTVKNARLISPIVTSSYSGARVAALIGKTSQCTIVNCLIVSPTVSATTSSTSNMVGALVGLLDCATVQNCFVISPTVSAEGSIQKGAICGYAYSTGENYYCTLTNVYYYDCSLDAIGQHGNSEESKLTNVGRAHLITLGSGVTGVSPAATAPENGFVYDSKTYYREGAELTLGSNLSATGKHAIFKTGGKTYTVNSTDGDVTLAAELTYNTYTVTFDGNGNTDGSMSDMNFTYDEPQNLTANAFTRTGYALAGWATSADGDVLYEDKEGVSNLTDTDVGTVTLYAKWTANTYIVTFNGNGNTDGSMSDMNFTYDVEQNLTANAFTRTGYAFAGWATSADGDVVYTDQQSVSNLTDTDGGTVTLYAKWTANTYIVTFNGNGNTDGSMSDMNFTYDVEQNLTANAFTRAFTVSYNYNGATDGNSEVSATATATFNGWAESDNDEKVYNDGQLVGNLTTEDHATVNLYAKWTDGSVTLPTPTKTGYTFAGWYSDSEFNTRLGDAGDAYTPSEDITLYAKWTANTYIVTFNGNGNTDGSMSDMNFTYDVEQNLTANAFTRTGYAFAGWATSADGDVAYTDQQSVSNLIDTDGGTVTLYAKWVVPYIDADGHTQTCNNFTVLTSETDISNLSAGWYVVIEDVNYNSNLYCSSGDIHLILCDGAKMTVNCNIFKHAIQIFKGSLTIYAQSTGSSMGELVATASKSGCDGINAGSSITICGGNITATGYRGIKATGNITIHSGDVNATGSDYGIYTYTGNITLGLRNATDYITASSYEGTVNIAQGLVLIDEDGTAAYCGNDVSIPNGQTLRLPVTITLADDITATSGVVEIGGNKYAKAGVTVTVSVTAPGYTFGGDIIVSPTVDVTDNGNGTYSFTMPEEAVTVTHNAKWTVNTYTVVFNGNGGTCVNGEMADMNFTYDVEQNLTANTFTRTHCIFAGWSTTADGDVLYTDQQSVSNLTDTDGGTVTLYAKWFVPYIDSDGHTQTCSNFTVLINTTNFDAGWYVVTEDVNYNSNLYCSTGDIHLILCDGAKMTVTESGIPAIYMSSGNLTIYAQSTGSSMGQLVATASDADGIDAHGNITICGGNITVMSNSSDEESDAENFGIKATGSVTIHSGQVSVSVSGIGNGIRVENGSITLGLRTATDYITATDYYGTVNIADGQTLTDGNISYSGNNVIAPVFRTLRLLLQTLALSDNGNNAEAIGEAAAASAGGRLYNATLSGRTLYKDGYWNTLVLPFDVTIASSPLAGDNVVAKVLSTTSKLDNGTLTLNFGNAPATIPAGTPFIIKWDKSDDLVNPVFTGVTINNTNRDVNFTGGSFMGTYAPLEITDANRSKVLLLSGKNKLGYAKTDRTIANEKALGTCRAYFYFPDSQTARSFVMNFGDDDTQTTGIVHTEITESTEMAGAIYDLQGRRIEKPKKGLYIHGGKKVVVH